MPCTVLVNGRGVVHQGSGGLSTVFPDVCKTPTPAGPVPIPYPNIGKSADTIAGPTVTWFGGGIGRIPNGTSEQDLLKVFWGLVGWSGGSPDPASPGYMKYKIERIWKY